jgi:hypothetical protein
MPRTVRYEILDQPDGLFAVIATMEPDRVYRRDDLATLAAAEDWIEGLRILMAACGAPLVREEAEPLAKAPTPGRTHRQSFTKQRSGGCRFPSNSFRPSEP